MKIKLFLEGLIIGLGKIIPGVSGALFAMLFGVYEQIIGCFSNPSRIYKEANTLLPLLSGIGMAIIFGSGLISYMLENYYSAAMSLFIGMMFYEIIPLILNVKSLPFKKRDFFEGVLAALLVLSMFLIDYKPVGVSYNPGFRVYISIFLCGILDSIATIIPGISGTSLLMLFGFYEIIISSIANVYLPVVIPFLLGLLLGLVMLSKVLMHLFETKRSAMHIFIISISSFSIFYLFIGVLKFGFNLNVIAMLSIGFLIARLVDKIS